MIDTHCHLEDGAFDSDRERVIEKCRETMKAVIMSCPDWRDFDKSLDIAKKHRGFVFLAAGIHPMYVNEVKPDEESEMMQKIRDNIDLIVGIGEVGLDYHWVKDDQSRAKQRDMFVRWIKFAQDIDRPLMIHIRDANKSDPSEEGKSTASEDAVRLLEENGAKRVHLHMFGFKDLVERVVANGWLISANNILQKSKTYRKVVARTPIENLMLETDCPWLGPDGVERNDPTTVKNVAERISDEKGMSFDDVVKNTTETAAKFYKLPISL